MSTTQTGPNTIAPDKTKEIVAMSFPFHALSFIRAIIARIKDKAASKPVIARRRKSPIAIRANKQIVDNIAPIREKIVILEIVSDC